MKQRLIGRAQTVQPNPSGQRELRPVAITSDIELQMIAYIHELRRVRAWPAALHAAKYAGESIVSLEVEKRNESGITLPFFQCRIRLRTPTGSESSGEF